MTGAATTPLLIHDGEVRDLVATLAARLGTTEQLAVKTAIAAELRRLEIEPTLDTGKKPLTSESKDGPSLRERLEDFSRRFPKPEPTGLPADKAFYDEMSGEFD